MPTPEERFRKRLTPIGIGLWVVVGCALRAWDLDRYAFSPDDALHVAEAALDSPLDVLAMLAREDTHPPLHYLLLHGLIKLGATDAVLRASSLVSSLLLIPLFFLLGRRISGTAGGLFAAFFATFSTPLILQAQVIRPYSLELLLLTGALLLHFGDREGSGRRRLFAYGALMALAILTHYSAVIAVAAVGGVALFHLVWERKGAAVLESGLLHLALAILAGLLFVSLASSLLDSTYRQGAVTSWLSHGFSHDYSLGSASGRLGGILVYFTDPPRAAAAVGFGVALLVGCVGLFKDRGFRLVEMALVALFVNALLSWWLLYPLAASRHALYLLPFLVPIAGSGFDWLWRATLARTPATRPIAIAAFSVASVLGTVLVVHNDGGRNSLIGFQELPLLREHYEETLAHIAESRRSDEILVGDKQLAYYAWYEGSPSDAEPLSPWVWRTRLGELDLYYFDRTRSLHSPLQLVRFLDDLEAVVGEPRPARLRFASLGWRGGLLYRIAFEGVPSSSLSPRERAIRAAIARGDPAPWSAGYRAGGGVVFSTTWEALREALGQTR